MNIPHEARLIGQRRGRDTQRQQFHQRIAALMKVELRPLRDRIPPAELASVAAAIWRKAYRLGYQTGHLRGRGRRAA